MVNATSPTVDPGLLDVVPWSHGYAHSWALRALLMSPVTAPLVLAALPQLPGPTPHSVEGDVHREKGLKPARADLGLTVRDASGSLHQIAIETKVNDPLSAPQIKAYVDAGYLPVLFLPGLTGLLIEPSDPVAGELRLFGHQVLAALEGVGVKFGAILSGYLASLRAESQRMKLARTAARTGIVAELGGGPVSEDDVNDHAWLAEVYRSLPRACADSAFDIEPLAEMRVTAHDRGIFFVGSYIDLGPLSERSGAYVDLPVAIGSHVRQLAIKVDGQNLAKNWDLVADRRAELGEDWWPSSRRVGGQTATVLKRSLADLPASDAAREAVRASEFLLRLKEEG